MLERAGRQGISDDDLSFTIDMCVDRGLVVPKVVDENDIWFRAFYSVKGKTIKTPCNSRMPFIVVTEHT